MVDYSKTTTTVRYGEVSDYSDNLVNRSSTFESTTDTKFTEQQFGALTTGTTISLAVFTTLSAVKLLNKDPANYVTVTYRTGAGVATTQTMKLLAGQDALLRDVTAATSLVFTANTATVEVELIAVGT
jgi:hypothetical protein